MANLKNEILMKRMKDQMDSEKKKKILKSLLRNFKLNKKKTISN
jgi:hypothetical protein